MPNGNEARWASYAKPGTYTTQLNPGDEAQFQQWVKQNRIPWQDTPNADYDMRGYWQARQRGDRLAQQDQKTRHFPDKWKTPYHSTFSRESQYALPTAGHWEGQTFVPPNGNDQAAQAPAAAPPGDFTTVHMKDGTIIHLRGKNLSAEDVQKGVAKFREFRGRQQGQPVQDPHQAVMRAQDPLHERLFKAVMGPMGPTGLGQEALRSMEQSQKKVPGTGVTVGEATSRAEDFAKKAIQLGMLLQGPGGMTGMGASATLGAPKEALEAAKGLGRNIAERLPTAEKAAAKMERFANNVKSIAINYKDPANAVMTALDNKNASQVMERFLERVTKAGRTNLTFPEAQSYYADARKALRSLEPGTGQWASLRDFMSKLNRELEMSLGAPNDPKVLAYRAIQKEFDGAERWQAMKPTLQKIVTAGATAGAIGTGLRMSGAAKAIVDQILRAIP
jgi:hypothetical protein